ncbi:MAG: glycoside hydrolase family 5 protein [Lachnospiraceae bacterium]|nr:glycoside hydrolase family 5 protein [Lachnospiraceae bacterium]
MNMPSLRFSFEQLPLPDTAAMRLTAKLGLGFNIGNSLDCVDTPGSTSTGLGFETLWGNPRTTPEMICALRDAGFGSIRLPVSWHNHVTGPDHRIDPAWMERVRQIVEYCLHEDLYVEINTHHDIREDLIYPDLAHEEQSLKLLTDLWEQIAPAFRDYDARVIFEPTNEVRLTGTPFEWSPDPADPHCLEAFEVICRMNQRFVDIVRESGGNNRTRFLSIPGYSTSDHGAMAEQFVLPKDPASERLFVSVHNYTPAFFAFYLPESGHNPVHFDPLYDGDPKNLPEDTACGQSVDASCRKLYEKFVRNGIPVHFNEFGCVDKNNQADRITYNAYYVAKARSYGMACFYWDNGSMIHSPGSMGIFDRRRLSFPDPAMTEAMVRSAR